MADEIVDLLSEYIRVGTSNPPGNEVAAVAFLADVFEREGIEYKTYEASAGRGSVKAVLRGSGKKGPIVLLNHLDVVPADASRWSSGPFSGEVRDGYVYGRGALDMKGQGIAELVAMLQLKRSGKPLCRDLVFLGVADEEVGQGKEGMRFLMDTFPEDFAADAVINEGSFFFQDALGDGRPLLAIATAEKGICSLRLTRKGTPGHASSPSPNNALELMVAALERLKSARTEPRVTSAVAGWYSSLAVAMPFLEPYTRNPDDGLLLKLLEENGVLEDPEQAPALQDTVSITGLRSGGDINVIPELAVAELDCRVLPGSSSAAMRDWVAGKLDDDQIEIEYVQRTEPSESPADTEYFNAIACVSAKYFNDPLVAPMLLTGTTDSTIFREKGVPSYGIFPVLVDSDEIKTIHGIDERVSIENLDRAGRIYTDLALRLCVE